MSHGSTSPNDLSPGPEGGRPSQLLGLFHSPPEVAQLSRRIYDEVLSHSKSIRTGNFTRISQEDLSLLFTLNNRAFFDGRIVEMLCADRAPLTYRLSRRMTSVAGKTTQFVEPRASGQRPMPRKRYEIAVSTVLLFGTFQQVDRPVTVGGLPCRDRLEALQRIFEHELLHLVEFLGWGDSDCKAANFHRLSQQIFGHAGVHHDLVTPRELAAQTYQIREGDMVSFVHEGQRLVGLVNRITRRATVLVEDPRGEEYQSGKRFLTFYVPLALLRKEGGAQTL